MTRGFNRPLNQFAQHQDKTRMYNFFSDDGLLYLHFLPCPPRHSPRLSWLDSVRSVSHFFFSTFPCRAAGNELTESKWGSEEDSQYNLRNLLFSAKPRETDSGRASQTHLIPVHNNFHILRTENEKNEWTPSSLAVNYPSSWRDLSSRSELRPTCTAFSGCLGWRSPSKVFALISPPLPASALTTAFYYTEGIWLMQCAVGPLPRANF